MPEPNIYIVIPVFNEARYIGSVIEGIQSAGYTEIVVVNDGSSDLTGEIARNHGALVIDHAVNLGAGAATQTGLTYSLQNHADMVVTIDGDGQHNPKEIKLLIQEMEHTRADLIIGHRFRSQNKIPRSTRILNWFGDILTFLMTGRLFTDSQSGFKVLNHKALKAIDLHLNGYAFCTEMLRQAVTFNLKVKYVPISVDYHHHVHKKGQNLYNGFITAFNLIFSQHPRKL
jgi:glycosyltransferase involved in cell wall biosynthesis